MVTRAHLVRFVAGLAAAVALVGSSAADPLSTAFTYQGDLRSNGVPVNGLVDLRFQLFGQAVGGAGVTTVQTLTAVPVSGGRFTVNLDFGVTVFTGDHRWLELQVRAPHDPGNAQPFTVLAPRQSLTATPYALQTRGIYVDALNRVGIGTTSPSYAVHVETDVRTRAVYGVNLLDSGLSYGLYGRADSTSGRGVMGLATATSGTAIGVYGQTSSSDGYAAYFTGPRSYIGGQLGVGTSAPRQQLSVGTYLDIYSGNANSPTQPSVRGSSVDNLVLNAVGSGAVYINYDSGSGGVRFHDGTSGGETMRISSLGRLGIGTTAPSTPIHVVTTGMTGVNSVSSNTNARALYGFANSNSGDAIGVIGATNSAAGYGVYSIGRFAATGTKSFQIDHPLDPANKVLTHFSAEGPEPYNLYRGNVVLGEDGTAWVELPEYFEAINRDFQYQLTCVGGHAPVYVASEVQGNAFQVAGGYAGLKVSWTVTAVRDDAFVRAYPLADEAMKAPEQRGRFLQPELYGASPADAVHAIPQAAVEADTEARPLDEAAY